MAHREPRIPDVMGGAYGDPSRRSPGPRPGPGYGGQGGGVGYDGGSYGPPPRQYSSDSTRPLARPPPQRQYSNGPPPLHPSASPNLLNNSGFDFNSGYSRPPTQGRDGYEYDDYGYNRRPSTGYQGDAGGGAAPAAPVPAPAPAAAYPGYKPYQPAADHSRQQEGWSGI